MRRTVASFVVVCLLFCFPCIGKADTTGNRSIADWKEENGYDFPVYGTTSVDLHPISDYLSTLADNGIYLELPDLLVTHKEDCEWIYTKIADDFYLTYVYYTDQSKLSLDLEVPRTYRPLDEAMILLLVSMLSMEYEEAVDLYGSLQYNVIGNWSVIETDEYAVSYYEPRYSNGKLAGFVTLSVEKELK